MQLLLLSNSTRPGKNYLEHDIALINALLHTRRNALFVRFPDFCRYRDPYSDKSQESTHTTGSRRYENI